MRLGVETGRRIGRAAEVADDLRLRVDPADANVEISLVGGANVEDVFVIASLRSVLERSAVWLRVEQAVDEVIRASCGMVMVHSASPYGFTIKVK